MLRDSEHEIVIGLIDKGCSHEMVAVCVFLCRHYNIDPGTMLNQMNHIRVAIADYLLDQGYLPGFNK